MTKVVKIHNFVFLQMNPSLSQAGYENETNICFVNTGCPTKNYTLFLRVVAPLNFELGIKVGGVLEFSGSQL